mmetsp:Transcript_13505/g.49132  ORF Transcript_13505/g.49132 Transcript_13505/m.49132 type:complete len:119 (-) Transcript_13505:1590-1946(-)|eukprot:scaffold7247_cov484-Prasinococcus_capsulatus_cf.AAC.2
MFPREKPESHAPPTPPIPGTNALVHTMDEQGGLAVPATLCRKHCRSLSIVLPTGISMSCQLLVRFHGAYCSPTLLLGLRLLVSLKALLSITHCPSWESRQGMSQLELCLEPSSIIPLP